VCHPLVEGVADRVVVDRLEERGVCVARQPHVAAPGVRTRVDRRGIPFPAVQPGVQLLPRVEVRPEHVDRRVRPGREHDGAVYLEVDEQLVGDLSAEDDEVPQLCQAEQSGLD
jgi:hypothetical protein